MMPMTAILLHELRTLARGWLVRLWLIASLFVSLLLAAGWQEVPAAPLVAQVLFPFLVFPWFPVVMVLGVSPVTGSRVGSLADGILSRPIARWQFLLGAWSARVVLVLGVFLVTTLPAVLWVSLADRPATEAPAGVAGLFEVGDEKVESSVTFYGTTAAVGVVALVLTFQVSLAFLLGTVLRNPVWTIVVLLFLWYPVNIVLHQFRLEEFSPLSLSQAVSTLVRQRPPWVETPVEKPQGPSVSESVDQFTKWFGPAAEDSTETDNPGFFQRQEYDDFSLAWVLAAYGVLTGTSLGLAMVCFGLRDL